MSPRDEDELMDPDQGGDSFDDPQPEIYLVDNGADTQIENLLQDAVDPVDVDEAPWLAQITDDDGAPGFHPFVDANDSFEKQAGLEDEADDAGDDVLGDEFASHVRKRNLAQYDHVGRPVSDLAQMAQSQAADTQAHTDIAPYARTNPPSVTAAMLGGSVTAQLFGPLVEVCRWTGEDAEATAVTVTLSMVLPNLLNVGGGRRPVDVCLRPYAVIQYGVRNTQITLEVDIGTGCQFTIGASSVNVMIGISGFDQTQSPPNAGSPQNEDMIQLIGQLSFRSVSHASPITRTVYTDQDGSDPIKLVPLFGKKLSVFRYDASVDGTVTLYDIVGYPMFVYDMPVGTYSIGPLLLPGSVYKFSVVNAAGGSNNSYGNSAAVFELAL